jgi:hypothetical protein
VSYGPAEYPTAGCDAYAGESCGCAECCELASCYDDCCDLARNWFSAEYLGVWTKGNNLPALVTTSPAGTPRADAGVLGVAGTRVLFGNESVGDEYRSGMRFTLGHWMDPDGCLGFQATYFSVWNDDNSGEFFAQTAGAGLPILARPFFNVGVAPNQEDARLVSFPGVTDGSIWVNSASEMDSIAILLRQYWFTGCQGRVDLLSGYRYFRLDDELVIHEQQVRTEVGVPIPIGTTYSYLDRFEAENEFHGGELGFVGEFQRECLTIEILAKVALGNLRRTAAIGGSNSIDTPPAGGAVTTPGGLLALPTNIGLRTTNDFAALPEFGFNVLYDASDALKLNLGYTFLALDDVIRTGDLIDRVVNSTQTDGGALVGAARPAPVAGQSDFWLQGFQIGATLRR